MNLKSHWMNQNKTTIMDCSIIDMSNNEHKSGINSMIENNKNIPFEVTRVFFLYDIEEGYSRGNHAHIECHQLLIAGSGSFQVIIDDGEIKKKVFLNKPSLGLYIPPGIWASETNFSKGSVCLVLASHKYDEKDYIRNYSDFIKFNS